MPGSGSPESNKSSSTGQSAQKHYTGRFAPSPTGPLHAGSLLTAVASYVDARANRGRWLVRMEDLDPPREQPGAADHILRQLEAFGLHWEGSVVYQSSRHEAYRQALEQLKKQGLIYYCTCTRQQLRPYGGHYPGLCRHRTHALPGAALRCRLDSSEVFAFSDLFQGQVSQRADEEGDVVVLRKDGLFAYQLAVVVDDGWQDITHIIRGTDLMESTARQHALQQFLGHPQPAYGHVPVLTDSAGQKLSKQQGALAVATDRPNKTLVNILAQLQQNPPVELAHSSVEEILAWAASHWMPNALAGRLSIATV